MSTKSKLSKLALKTIIVILTLIVLLALGGLFLPQAVNVSDTNLILSAPQQDLFELFNSHDGHREMWTSTAIRGGLEPMSFSELGGPESGVGTRFCFCPQADSSNDSALGIVSSLASGYGIITESVEPSRVVIEIDWSFMRSRRIISLTEREAGRVEVSWQEEFILANPLLRYIPIFLKEIDFSPPIEVAAQLIN